MIEQKSGEPYINVWFGNFYRPAYDDQDFIDETVSMLKNLGFNSVLTDSKAWEDFRQRFAGGEASQYVAQQEYLQQRLLDAGLSYEFMALYLNSDNLYPVIRFSPPIYGESVTNPDGEDGKWYKYWSKRAQDSMIGHLKGLMETYGKGCTAVELEGEERMPVCTMWDPIVAPSFDEEGRSRYLNFLKAKYGSIEALNRAYQTDYPSFDAMRKEDYWSECAFETPLYTKEELDRGDRRARLWIDNMEWRSEELCLYFQQMQARIRQEVDSRILTCPVLTQWSYFLSVDTSQLTTVGFADLWDTANRGVDFYKVAGFVDCATFCTVPVTPYGDPDAYVTSCQHSMMRPMNRGREWIGGIYWGRFLYNHVYEFLTPAEIIGSMVGCGISGYSSYGCCGLDDGGVLHRMDSGFLDSLKTGNEWAKRVIPKIRGERKKQVAILFPSAMAQYEPMGVDGNKERRCDLLGYYKMCCDFGYMADVIDLDLVAEGALKEYEALIIPENDCYSYAEHPQAEAAIREWVTGGGIVLTSPDDTICPRLFGYQSSAHTPSPIDYCEGGLVVSDQYQSFEAGEPVAVYRTDGACAVAKVSAGKGRVYAFGFAYGYSYCTKIAPHVPLSEGNNELYPVPMMKRNIVNDIFQENGITGCPYAGPNIETAVFEDAVVIVNHTSQPVRVKLPGEMFFQYDMGEGVLLPRSAVCVKPEERSFDI